eukprot:CAMPEP_0116059286 /NCGR_PEP_ID=MMETSP0322-20121206/5702_1 /TAXON_ID=163516 /ORGANISM="Leptocylindrus danicus var. apora, Strain B651" /LENGTH=276 /DNA_ID=CAMNT_0003543631 /DNA_START=165 /DNA_END=995 /DNA_ORIENTATION=-
MIKGTSSSSSSRISRKRKAPSPPKSIHQNLHDFCSDPYKLTRTMMRPTDTLPSTGMDILIVGNVVCAKSCQILADALLRNKLDTSSSCANIKNPGKRTSVSKNTCSFHSTLGSCLRARHVRISKALPLLDDDGPRVDFVVLVISVRDRTCLDYLRACSRNLHADYFIYKRCVIVLVDADDSKLDKSAISHQDLRSLLLSSSTSSRSSSSSSGGSASRCRRLFLDQHHKLGYASVFRMDGENENNCAYVSRMILKLVKVGCRQTGSLSPLFSTTLLL